VPNFKTVDHLIDLVANFYWRKAPTFWHLRIPASGLSSGKNWTQKLEVAWNSCCVLVGDLRSSVTILSTPPYHLPTVACPQCPCNVRRPLTFTHALPEYQKSCIFHTIRTCRISCSPHSVFRSSMNLWLYTFAITSELLLRFCSKTLHAASM